MLQIAEVDQSVVSFSLARVSLTAKVGNDFSVIGLNSSQLLTLCEEDKLQNISIINTNLRGLLMF